MKIQKNNSISRHSCRHKCS